LFEKIPNNNDNKTGAEEGSDSTADIDKTSMGPYMKSFEKLFLDPLYRDIRKVAALCLVPVLLCVFSVRFIFSPDSTRLFSRALVLAGSRSL
jgi:hypothetical protein